MPLSLERETGIEPATNGLGSRYSTIELLPPEECIQYSWGDTLMAQPAAIQKLVQAIFRSLAALRLIPSPVSRFALALLLLAPALALASPSGDLSAWLRAEDARLGASPGTIVIDHPGRINAPLTLGVGHNLSLTSAVDWAATVRLAGKNAIDCTPSAAITAHLPAFNLAQVTGMLLLAQNVSHVRVTGCRVTSGAVSVLVAGLPVSDLDLTGNSVTDLMLLLVNGSPNSSQRLTLAKNTLTSTKPAGTYAGIQLNSAKNVVVSGNSFTNLLHGAMWWGGDSAAPGASLQQVTTTGALSFISNQCKHIGGSCIWGSMGYDILMRGNTADGCGDVCFDTEGGLRTQIIDNTALSCQNGCAGVFFFTDQTVISGNHFRAQVPGGGLIFIKNSSQNPSAHDHMLIRSNDLTCLPDLCRAVYQEAAGGIEFVANEVTNGVWLPLAYARSVTVTGNHLVYSKPLSGVGAALAMPGMMGGTVLEVTGNRVESNVPQPAGSACIAASWTDFNATDTHLIAGNTCAGTSPFPLGLSIVSSGQNPGVAGVWILSANHLGSAPVSHITKTPNEHFYDLGECDTNGCHPNPAAMNAVRGLQGCGGKAPAVAGSISVCLGGVRGWAAVPLPH